MKAIDFLFLNFFLLYCFVGFSQEEALIPMNASTWKVNAEEFRWTDYKGEKSLYLKEGLATVTSVSLDDGIIDFDIAVPNARMFTGIQFRQQDPYNYEEFYIRPHQSDKPDAMQYTPVFNGSSGWQLYAGKGHWAAYGYDFDNWMHIRIILSGQQMELYINDMEKPVLYAPELKRSKKAGYLCLRSSMEGAYFANVRYRKVSNPKILSTAPKSELQQGSIQSWQISSTFPDSVLGSNYQIPESLKKTLRWNRFSCESSGLINLARNNGIQEPNNMAFAKITLQSDKEQVKRLDLGYSDQVVVYLNGKALYSGQNIFRSRDYRYLGSIGYFDGIFLPLKKGRNELWIAVSENFGGWGIKGRLAQPKGVRIE